MTFLLSLILLGATTYKTIQVDGNLDDWGFDELVIPDSPTDCPVTGNEIYGVYVTWDRNNLYVACSYKLQQKALLVVIDRGIGKGVHDINNLDWYPRNFQFYGMNADILIALWNADLGTGGVREITGEVVNNRVRTLPLPSVSVQNKALPGDSGGIEVSLPFSSLYPSGIPNGASIKIVALIAGSDHEGGVESAPDNSAIRPYQASPVRRFVEICIDADSNLLPDSGVVPVAVKKIVEIPEKPLKISTFQLSQRSIRIGESVDIDIEISDYANIDVSIYDEYGKLVAKRIWQNGVPGQIFRYSWDLKDLSGREVKQGIYIVVVKAGEYVREKRAIFVYR
ncbi:MAG: hypothetical protein ABIM32_04550 [candidate division WOR-3 bacterium]